MKKEKVSTILPYETLSSKTTRTSGRGHLSLSGALIKYFDLILFNFVFANGDAHIKNFSVLQTPQGDYKLSPAYDLINSSLHIYSGSIFALQKGLFPGWNRELDKFCAIFDKKEELIEQSLLNEKLKNEYRTIYHTRIKSFLRVR